MSNNPVIETALSTPFGEYELRRYPFRRGERLRAWDAADEYLIEEFSDLKIEPDGIRLLIVNDNFGALATTLHAFCPVLLSDSYISHMSTRVNFRQNNLSNDDLILCSPLEPLNGYFDVVLIRVTKTLGLLEDELLRIRPHIDARTRIFGCGMSKQIHTSTLKLFTKLLGPTKTSLAKKKARVIYSEFDVSIIPHESIYPICYRLENHPYMMVNHASVFSRDKLDVGTRFFIQQIPEDSIHGDIIDLGCGNGVAGLIAAELNPDASVLFYDESYMAVASAQASYEQSGLFNRAEFRVGDCLDGYSDQSADLILCNPPFHQQQVVGDYVAMRMFKQSRRALKPGGELLVIGNRHLGYHIKLKRLFNQVETIASNSKFVVLSAQF